MKPHVMMAELKFNVWSASTQELRNETQQNLLSESNI